MSLHDLGIGSERRLAYCGHTLFCGWLLCPYECIEGFSILLMRQIAYRTGCHLALVPGYAKFHNELI